jgi:putative peptidoglycan lipid II flippase
MVEAKEEPDSDEGLPANLGRSAVVMAVGTTLSRVTGLGRLVAMAYALGVTERGRLADSYNIANTMPNVIYELILGGVLTSVFIPVLVEELRKKRDDDAWESVSALVTTSIVTVVAITLVAILGAPWIIRLFTFRASGPEQAQQQALATFFLRFFAPQIAFYGVAAVAGGLLNAHDRFAVPMFAPILNNVVVIGTFLAFSAIVSGTPDNAVGVALSQKLLLAVGTTGGVAVMALAHWPYVRRLPGKLRWRPDFRHPSVRKLARLSLWTLGYVVANQISFSVGLVLAEGVKGGVTAMFTAFAFFQLPYGVAAVSIMTALVPRMSAQAVEGDEDGFRASLGTGMRLMGLLLLPATAGYLVLSRPLVTVLLQHGVMSAGSSALVAEVLSMFAIGLVPFSFYLLLLRAFYARQDARTPTLVNVVLNTVYAIFSLILFPAFRVQGLALAHSLCYVTGALVAGVMLSRRMGGLGSARTFAALGRTAVASVVAAGAMIVAVQAVNAAMGPSGERALAQLVAGLLAGGIAFLAAAKALRLEELDTLRNLLPGRSRSTSALG